MRKLLVFFLIIIAALNGFGQTAVPISQLPPAVSITGSELVPIVQSATTKRTTVGAIRNLVDSAYLSQYLSTYLKSSTANTLYQPIGSYITTNIYTADGTLQGNRIVNGNNKTFQVINSTAVQFNNTQNGTLNLLNNNFNAIIQAADLSKRSKIAATLDQIDIQQLNGSGLSELTIDTAFTFSPFANVYSTKPFKYTSNLVGSYDDRTLPDKHYVDSLSAAGPSTITVSGDTLFICNFNSCDTAISSVPAQHVQIASDTLLIVCNDDYSECDSLPIPRTQFASTLWDSSAIYRHIDSVQITLQGQIDTKMPLQVVSDTFYFTRKDSMIIACHTYTDETLVCDTLKVVTPETLRDFLTQIGVDSIPDSLIVRSDILNSTDTLLTIHHGPRTGLDTVTAKKYFADATHEGFLKAVDWNTFNNKEPALGNPASNGYVLSSTTGGVRSWVAQSVGGTGIDSLMSSNDSVYGRKSGVFVFQYLPRAKYFTDYFLVLNDSTVKGDKTKIATYDTALAAYQLFGNMTSSGANASFFTNTFSDSLRRIGLNVQRRVNGTWITQYQDTTGGGGGGSAAGSDYDIQYSLSGIFSASSTFNYKPAPTISSGLARGLIIRPALPNVGSTDTTIAVDIWPTLGTGYGNNTMNIGLRVLNGTITNTNDYTNSSSLGSGGGLTIVEPSVGQGNKNVAVVKTTNTSTGGLVVQLVSGSAQSAIRAYKGATSLMNLDQNGLVTFASTVTAPSANISGPLNFFNANAVIAYGNGITFSSGTATNAVEIVKDNGNVLIGSTTDVPTSKLTVVTTTQGSVPAPSMSTTQRDLVGTGVGGGSITAAGSGYTNGTFTLQSLTGGSGTGAVATITVSGNAVTAVSISTTGSGYFVGDVLSASLAGGSGFTFTVTVPTAASGLSIFNTTQKATNVHNSWNWTGSLISSSASTLSLNYGRDYIFTGTTTTWTLPVVTISGVTSPVGRMNSIEIKNRGSGAITLNSATGNTLYTTSATNTITINAGAACELLPDGTYFLVMFNQ